MTTSSKTTGSKALTGSVDARRLAAGILEVLSGVNGPQEGAAKLGISLNRYYQLETKSLQGMVLALEPLPRGRQQTPERKLASAERDNARLVRELSRYRALLRAAQRSLGLSPPKQRKIADKVKTGRRRRRTKTVRATKAIAALSKTVPS